MDNLSISLTERRARQTEWRVFAILTLTSVLFGLTILCYFASTQSLRVVNTVTDAGIETLAFKRTLKAKRLSVVRQELVPGMPFSLNDLASGSTKAVAFHYGEQGLVGVSVHKASEELTARAQTSGLLVEEIGAFSTFSITPLEVSEKPSRVFFLRTLFVDGLYRNGARLAPIQLTNNHIKVRGGGAPFTESSVHLPASAIITSVSNTNEHELIYGMGPYRLIQGTVDNTPFFHLTAGPALETQTLIQFGTEIMLRNTLSTQAWTSTDLYKRSRLTGKEVTPTISSDGDITIVSFLDTSASLYIVKTKEVSTITTILPTAELLLTAPRNNCAPRAHSFVSNRSVVIAESKGATHICF